jgi:hypothetical protein
LENHPLRVQFRSGASTIPGKNNVVADGLTRVNRVTYGGLSRLKKPMYRDDTLTRIFRLEGKDGDVEEIFEDEDSQLGTVVNIR